MNKQRKFILAASVLGIVAVFLPWISVSAGAFGYSVSESRNGFHGMGVLYFLLMVVVLVLAVTGEQSNTLEKNKRLGVLGTGLFALICLLITYSNAQDDVRGGMGFASSSVGIGMILAALSAVAVIIIPILIKKPGESLNGDLMQLKTGMKSMQGNISIPSVKKTDLSKSKMDELERLIQWRNEGRISQEEYEVLKSKII